MAWKNTDPEKIREYNRKYYAEKTKLKRQQASELKVRDKRECPICKTTFIPETNRQIYCCEACALVARKLRARVYRQTETYKEKMKEYRQTESYKQVRDKYRKSEKGKKAIKRYLMSEKGQQARARSLEKRKGDKK